MEIYVSFSSSSLHLFGYSVVHASKEVASEEMMKSYAFVIYEFRFGNKGVQNLFIFVEMLRDYRKFIKGEEL